jgi:hypothetical protein
VSAGSRYYSLGYLLPDDEVPAAVKLAAALLAHEDVQGTLVEVVDQARLVKRQRTGPIEREFFAPGKLRVFPHVNRELWGLYAPRSGVRALERV